MTYIPGRKIGRLTLISHFTIRNPNGAAVKCWRYVCKCGKHGTVRSGNLSNGSTRSCGCLAREIARINHTTHGESKKKPEWLAWKNMIDRCGNKRHFAYKNYGGRGIRVCHKWRASYTAFLADVGRRPSSDHSLNRKNNSKGYFPGNVNWATWHEQQNNRRSSIHLKLNGIYKTISEWARIYSISVATVFSRLHRGWAPEDALKKPSTLSTRVHLIYSELLKVAKKDL